MIKWLVTRNQKAAVCICSPLFNNLKHENYLNFERLNVPTVFSCSVVIVRYVENGKQKHVYLRIK